MTLESEKTFVINELATGCCSHRPLHSSFYFSLSWRAAKAHEGLQPAWPAVAALPEIPIRQRPAPSGNARPQSAGAGLGKHQSGPGKARIQAQAPLPHDGRKPAPRLKSQPGARRALRCPCLNARRARAQPLAARRRLQSPASILSPCCGQPQRQAGEFLESAPFESSLPKGMLTCP